MYISWLGSVHYAHVVANSDMFAKADAGTLFPDKKRHICGQDVLLLMLGDPAYSLLSWLMKPFSDCGALTPRQAKFHYQLSRARIDTEIAVCRLMGRWRFFLKRNDTGQQCLVQLVAAAVSCTISVKSIMTVLMKVGRSQILMKLLHQPVLVHKVNQVLLLLLFEKHWSHTSTHTELALVWLHLQQSWSHTFNTLNIQ